MTLGAWLGSIIRAQTMKMSLAIVNVLALWMLTQMTDVARSMRFIVAALLLAGLGALVGRQALAATPARWGARLSLVGYSGAVVFWWLDALGCGIEYFNKQCDGVIWPVIWLSLVVGLTALPIGRLAALVVRSPPPGPKRRGA